MNSNNTNKITIVTHDKSFHADDVGACVILEKVFGSNNTNIIRSRDEKIVSNADITVDVGKIYDPNNNRFDHHIYDKAYYFDDENKWIMSSIGMVYKKFGRQYLQQVININENNHIFDKLYWEFYHRVVKEFDLIDNGISVSSPQFLIRTNITTMVGVQNYNDVYDHEKQMKKFKEAMIDVGKMFECKIFSIYNILTEKKFNYKNNIFNKKSEICIFISKDYNLSINSNILTSIVILNYLHDGNISVIFYPDEKKVSSKNKFYDFRDKQIFINNIFDEYGNKFIEKKLNKNGILNISKENLQKTYELVKKTIIREFVKRTYRIKQSEGSFNLTTDLSSLIRDCAFTNSTMLDIFNLIDRYMELTILNIYDEVINDNINKMLVESADRNICDHCRIMYINKSIKNINKYLRENKDEKTHLIIMFDEKQWNICTYRDRCKISKIENQDIVFIHHHFFCAATKTLEMAIFLCKKTLEDLDDIGKK